MRFVDDFRNRLSKLAHSNLAFLEMAGIQNGGCGIVVAKHKWEQFKFF